MFETFTSFPLIHREEQISSPVPTPLKMNRSSRLHTDAQAKVDPYIGTGNSKESSSTLKWNDI
jgi:hypothetical protein